MRKFILNPPRVLWNLSPIQPFLRPFISIERDCIYFPMRSFPKNRKIPIKALNMVIPMPLYIPSNPSCRKVSFTQCHVEVYLLSHAIKGLTSSNDDMYCVWYLVLIVSTHQSTKGGLIVPSEYTLAQVIHPAIPPALNIFPILIRSESSAFNSINLAPSYPQK